MKLDAIRRVADALCCPCCGAALSLENGSLVCGALNGKRHCFDIARSGYVNLDTAHAGGGDGKELVAARTAFLESGAYDPISDAVNELLSRYVTDGLVIDAGCGEGYYTNRAAVALPHLDFLGADLSKTAVDSCARSAARKGSRAAFAVAGIFSLPVRDGAASAVMNLFAPCAETEFARVLRKDGILILVGAGEDHLYGLKRAVYDTPYRNTARADLPKEMTLVEERRVSYTAALTSNEQIRALFSMTPYAFRTSREDLLKLDTLETLETEVDVTVSVYRRM